MNSTRSMPILISILFILAVVSAFSIGYTRGHTDAFPTLATLTPLASSSTTETPKKTGDPTPRSEFTQRVLVEPAPSPTDPPTMARLRRTITYTAPNSTTEIGAATSFGPEAKIVGESDIKNFSGAPIIPNLFDRAAGTIAKALGYTGTVKLPPMQILLFYYASIALALGAVATLAFGRGRFKREAGILFVGALALAMTGVLVNEFPWAFLIAAIGIAVVLAVVVVRFVRAGKIEAASDAIISGVEKADPSIAAPVKASIKSEMLATGEYPKLKAIVANRKSAVVPSKP